MKWELSTTRRRGRRLRQTTPQRVLKLKDISLLTPGIGATTVVTMDIKHPSAERGQNRRRRSTEKNRSATSSKVSCYKCNEEEHITPNCPVLRKGNRTSKDERRVDSCVVEAPTDRLSHLGESFPFCFDSGAECSLIKESAASKFSGKRTTDIIVMRRIGNTCVKSTSQILSTICINGFALEITFHVLTDKLFKT